VVNDPAGEPRYEALVLAFGDELVRAQRDAQEAGGVRDPAVVCGACAIAVDDELAEAVARAGSFLQARAVSPAVRRHRLQEVLLLLAERGHRFLPVEQLGWDERVRRLVAQRPDADWTVEALAAAFHASPSTLRRRLEGSALTLAALVREVRLETALTLLQTTRLPVGEIAQRCGWESHSRFSAAFQERWGFAPSVLRAGVAQGAQPLTQAS
jgi:AraC-like DNA-binding protein